MREISQSHGNRVALATCSPSGCLPSISSDIAVRLTSFFSYLLSAIIPPHYSTLWILSPPVSEIDKMFPRSSSLLTLLSLSPCFPDYGADRPGVWEQPAHQLRRRSQFPEVPADFLRGQPVVPPHRGGLGLGLQSRPEGEHVPDVVWSSDQMMSCHSDPGRKKGKWKWRAVIMNQDRRNKQSG